MGLFTNLSLDSLDDLFLVELQDLYDAEQRLTEAIPKMAEAAHNPKLKEAFNHHLEETKSQVTRLEQVFKSLDQEAKSETCQAMRGLIAEGEEIIKSKGPENVRDAALIAAAQRVEHYEMAGYGSARNFAMRLGHQEAARLLQETLDEEGRADKTLTELAEQNINVQAQNA